jgi:hypothetical protein
MKGFHLLVSLTIGGGGIKDTQCGFKLFTRYDPHSRDALSPPHLPVHMEEGEGRGRAEAQILGTCRVALAPDPCVPIL